ncbi:hypothetical protein [Lacunimicrobium album]
MTDRTTFDFYLTLLEPITFPNFLVINDDFQRRYDDQAFVEVMQSMAANALERKDVHRLVYGLADPQFDVQYNRIRQAISVIKHMGSLDRFDCFDSFLKPYVLAETIQELSKDLRTFSPREIDSPYNELLDLAIKYYPIRKTSNELSHEQFEELEYAASRVKKLYKELLKDLKERGHWPEGEFIYSFIGFLDENDFEIG